MSYFIGIEDLAANALIELVEKTGKRTVLFSQLNSYGNAIMANLKNDNMDVTLIFTKDTTEQFFHDCSDVFSIKEVDNDIEITLKDGISTDVLRNRFRVNIAFYLLKAFVSKSALEALSDILV